MGVEEAGGRRQGGGGERTVVDAVLAVGAVHRAADAALAQLALTPLLRRVVVPPAGSEDDEPAVAKLKHSRWR